LIEAGADLVAVYDPDPAKVAAFVKTYPQARVAQSEQEILQDARVKLVASAAVPCDRGPLGVRVMRHGKDYFTDKCPFTTLAQLAEAREVVAETGRKYAVYYSERLHNESAVFAGQLIHSGAIGRVLQVIGLGPHRINVPSRPVWFFELARYGGILCDIGSHQVEQFLYYSGATDGTVMHSKVANYAHPDYPELQDFGDATIVGNNGATNYFRVDWFTPNGLSTWGDGRTIIMGTQGYIELRKYVDVTRGGGDQVYLVDQQREQHFDVAGQVGYPFFGELIRDCLNRTELAMTQAHTFKAAELAMQAQAVAMMIV
jgi:predicted dehydrogenase